MRMLATGHTDALHFLSAWQNWRLDPERPRLLHYVWTTADAGAVSLAAPEQLQPLARKLAAQWPGAAAGFHRLVFENGQVLLTVCVGKTQAMLQAQQFEADAVLVDAPTADWDSFGVKALVRCCRRGARLEARCPPHGTEALAALLTQQGFVLQPPDTPGLLQGRFDPPWNVRQRTAPHSASLPENRRCTVIGAGLAGASVAASLARRGWQVTVLDAAAQPAAGASGVPVALLAPHVSADDGYLSRLSRAGVCATLQQARSLLRAGLDWAETGVLEHRLQKLPDAGDASLWHPHAGWLKPEKLVLALLSSPHIAWQGHARVEQLAQSEKGWEVRDPDGMLLGEADLVVVAAGYASRALLGPGLAVQAVRGQMSWQLHTKHGHGENGTAPGLDLFPAFPVNGAGSLIARVPTEAGPAWFAGATFERDQPAPVVTEGGHQANLQRLRTLLPALADALAQQHASHPMGGWSGVRCTTPDRLPLLGPVDAPGQQAGQSPGNLWLCTGFGSRGLTWAVLCAELLAARLHGEPLPVELQLAQALNAQRFSH